MFYGPNNSNIAYSCVHQLMFDLQISAFLNHSQPTFALEVTGSAFSYFCQRLGQFLMNTKAVSVRIELGI